LRIVDRDVVRSVRRYRRPLTDAWRGRRVRLDGMEIRIPGPRAIRLSVVGGNLRVHRLMDRVLRPGMTVLDVGANVGYNTVYAAARVGARGRVVALEPAADNFAVLQENIAANDLANVASHRLAAGAGAGVRRLFVRGDLSAVNSFYSESCYSDVTGVADVTVVRLDDVWAGTPDLVKIDVEGAELEVLDGMTRLLASPEVRLIVEWHPLLQQMAGFAAEALPQRLFEARFRVWAAWHSTTREIVSTDVPQIAAQMIVRKGSLELYAARS
jgi:FkbM family methyltransferase